MTRTEDRLREALGTLAEQVSASPQAYRRAQAAWRRRERRRRLWVAVVAAVMIALADLVGLWAVNQARSGAPVVFDAPAPARVVPAPHPSP